MPALKIIADHGSRERGMRMRDVSVMLRKQITPTPEDLEILKGRVDDRLSQVIRNLVSHKTLAKGGLATYSKDPATGDLWVNLTEMGWASITPNQTPIYR